MEVVEVAPHLFGRHQCAVHCHLVKVRIGREGFGEHAFLYATGNTQLTADAFFLGIDFRQPIVAAHRAPHDEYHQGKSQEQENKKVVAHMVEIFVYLSIGKDYSH